MDGLWVNVANAAENGTCVRTLSDIDQTARAALSLIAFFVPKTKKESGHVHPRVTSEANR